MLKQYIKQAWRVLRENPVLSAISIFGTALAICMIMVLVMTHQVKNAPYPPEVNRDRTLYVKWMTAEDNEGISNNGIVGSTFAREVFKSLKSAEVVSVATYMPEAVIVSPVGTKKGTSFDKRLVDEAFWQVFEFDFIAGVPFTKADVDAGLKKAVISESVAKKTFGKTNVVGERIMLNYTEYEVQAVVKDVSTLFSAAYSQIFTPLGSEELANDDYSEGISGMNRVYILARSPKDFDKIREEAEANRLKYNAGTVSYKALFRDQPDDHFSYTIRSSANQDIDRKGEIRTLVITFILLLIVPAINLSGITISMMRKRLSELGLRRSFGATKGDVLRQVLFESFIQTLFGGAIGLIFSYGAAYLLKDMLLKDFAMTFTSGDLNINLFSLITPTIFLSAFLFCLLLNLLSAYVPAWRVSRVSIVESLQSK